ncbi:MAG: hypothetical protein MUP15_08845, partial [Dehalococcoidia bacterium]|nr:hypothetical protein [Dehalococcoidia bacterium]
MGRFVHDRQIGLTERVSVDSEGTQANGDSATGSVEGATPLAISADGRFVAFPSNATNLVAADTNVCGTPPNTDNCPDVFVHDRETGATERVSVDSLGNEANGASAVPAISANGRYVAFISSATNLAEGDTYPNFDIFVHDRATGTTERVSVTSAGNETHHNSWGPTISGDGRYVVFDSWAPDLVTPATSNRPHLFVRDRVNGTTELLPVGSETYAPAISANGGFIAFGTQRSLVPEDTNWAPDVYL